MNKCTFFISYRREDTAGTSGRLFDFLETKFGSNALFQDVDKIPKGADFKEIIKTSIEKCSFFLLVIGDKFTNSITETGKSKLFSEEDHLRFEINTAIDKNKLIIPILVDDAKMPKNTDIPNELFKVTMLNAFHVRNSNWKEDCQNFYNYLINQYGEKYFLKVNILPDKILTHTFDLTGDKSPYQINVLNNSYFTVTYTQCRPESWFEYVGTFEFLNKYSKGKRSVVKSYGMQIWDLNSKKCICEINETDLKYKIVKVLSINKSLDRIYGLTKDTLKNIEGRFEFEYPNNDLDRNSPLTFIEWGIQSKSKIREVVLQGGARFAHIGSTHDYVFYKYEFNQHVIEKFDLSSCSRNMLLKNSSGYFKYIKLSNDEDMIAAINNNLRMWDSETGKIAFETTDVVDFYSFADNKTQIVTQKDDLIKVWNYRTNTLSCSFKIEQEFKELYDNDDYSKKIKKNIKRVQSCFKNNVVLCSGTQIEGWDIQTGEMTFCYKLPSEKHILQVYKNLFFMYKNNYKSDYNNTWLLFVYDLNFL